MNRKTPFSMVCVIIAIALTACATAIPATTSPNDDVADGTEPTASSNIPTSESLSSPIIDTDTGEPSTLACGNGSTSASLTPELTEGPYYTANSPERASLFEEGMTGTKIVITGNVYTIDCQPVANALLDFWQANANGEYDNSGYTLRGHQFTDANGHYQLTTVVPGIYPGRTEHIHVKVQSPNGKLITTQLFFPGVAQNDSDGIFAPGLLLSIQESDDGLQGQFNFVVPGTN